MPAHYLKEELRQIWEQDNRNQAPNFLHDKCRSALGIRVRQTMVNTLDGANSKFKTLKRLEYGYRDEGYFHHKFQALRESIG